MAEPILLRMAFSHYCRKAEWGLTQAGIPYQTLDVRLLNMKDQYRANPEGTVPVLRVGDELLFGAHAALRWAEAHRELYAPRLYPPLFATQIEAWESWADSTLGAAVRREAYRALLAKPALAAAHGLPFWMRLPPARRIYLGILKLLKARRFDDVDPKVLREAVGTIAAQLGRSNTGFLFGPHATAADYATAALLEPLVPAAHHLGYDREPGWGPVAAHIERIRPAHTSRSGGRRIREADWQEFERMNAATPPAPMPALRCECGAPDWTKT